MSQVNRNHDKDGGAQGPAYFRSLEHLTGSERLAAEAATEFPTYNPTELTRGSRRSFMKLAGAAMALAGVTLSGCRRWPKEEIVPYTASPKDRTPGVPEHYASAFELSGVADGVVVTTYDGRPIKIEGNPDHPYSVAYAGNEGTRAGRYGASNIFAQASLLEMYDPDRSRGVRLSGEKGLTPSTWDAWMDAAKAAIGSGAIAFLSTPTSSPSVKAMWEKLAAGNRGVRWYEYEPLSRDNVRDGTKLAFGKSVRPLYDFKVADVIVSLDSDFLTQHPASLRYAADWADRRRRAETDKTMNRVHIVESVTEWVKGATADLKRAGKAAAVIPGTHLAPQTIAVAMLINAHLGNADTTIKYVEVPGDRPSHLDSIKQLAADLGSGAVKGLVILGGNPAYDAPADLKLGDLIKSAGFSTYHGLYENETSLLCQWHVPEAHYLESWGDARAYDGTITLIQPMIEPLFGGKTKAELLAGLAGEAEQSGKLISRKVASVADELKHKQYLQTGVVPGTGFSKATVAAQGFPQPASLPTPTAFGLEVRFVRWTMYDGRYANLGWLAELPETMTKLTWDNALILSKKDADALGVKNGDLVAVDVGGTKLEIAAYMLPGQPVGVAQLPLGFARKAAGAIGNANGFDTYSLRTTTGFHWAPASVVKTGGSYSLATTQEHYLNDWVAMKAHDKRIGKPGESGKIIREATLEQYAKDPKSMQKSHGDLRLQLWDPPVAMNNPHAWGMAIDMSACTGCGNCIVACQAENNISTVGKHQVLMHRAMHWIRIDRYFKYDAKKDPDIEKPEVVFQPMMCVHCENAPCEQVCPVAATVHDTEGLNTMVYNRCIGTRYCSNNCPYKVRRFNYFDYHSTSPREGLRKPYPGIPDAQLTNGIDPIKAMVFNPEVSLRMRGVMEKCTYCTQRIQTAKITARNEYAKGNRGSDKVPDGTVLTACQQSCPTQAIWFGDLNDRGSRVVKWQASPRSYDVLAELNTRPRTKYLGKLRNPVPGGETAAKTTEGHG
jgi:MoCo/4Fe-4S cofactor protein with predicted Tat translocation signal